MLIFILFTCLYLTSTIQSKLIFCDFESYCEDFDTKYHWGISTGVTDEVINHDHTLNTSAGHYLFYDPHFSFQDKIAEIKTINWLEPLLNHSLCFQMWYYTPRLSFPFNIQLVQGADELLVRTVATIPGRNGSSKDWIPINIRLPNEKLKLFIRTNVTNKGLAFDDLSIDFCDDIPPKPSKVLYSCDFESSCSKDFVSLSTYPYSWFITSANEAQTYEPNAPSIDYSFQNQSGHYAFVANTKTLAEGKVGYLQLENDFEITADESYCLNFQYFSSGYSYKSYLKIYARMIDQNNEIQLIWPLAYPEQYGYLRNNWTWGITNLPIGRYNLLFSVNTNENSPRLYALDNILITSCDYPPRAMSDDNSLLSFSCNFDNSSMCDMINGDFGVKPKYNFTVFTSQTIPDPSLGPTHDHTSNSTDGGFLYWDRKEPYSGTDNGRIRQPSFIELNTGMCIKFAYYVKSQITGKNSTQLYLSAAGSFSALLWSASLDDSQGWQSVIVPIDDIATTVWFDFDVSQTALVPVAVAFDDIEIDQCTVLIPTTTTITSTTTTTTTSTSTSTIATSTSTSTIDTSTITVSTSISTVDTSTLITLPNHTSRLLSLNISVLIFSFYFINLVKNIFL